MSSARSASFASALSQGASFAFDDLDVSMDSPIARYPQGGKRAVTIMSPNAERERMAEQENLGSMTPAAKRSAAPTPQSILKSTPARSTTRSTVAAVQPPPSAAKFRVTNTTSAAPAPSAPGSMKPSRTAPNTPRRGRAMSELSEMGVTPYVDRYVAELKSKQDEREQKEAEEAAAKRAAAREAKKQATAAAAAAAASQQEERQAHHRKRHQANTRDESDDEGTSDEDGSSPKGRQTNPAVRALRNAMNMDVATPAAWKGRGAGPAVDDTARNTIEMEADELMRQPDLADPAAPAAKKNAKAQKVQTKPVPKKVAPKKPASRRQRSPSYDDNDFGDDGNFDYDDDGDGASDASYDIAPPAKAHRGQKQQQPAVTTRPRRRLTAQAEDVESALLSAAPAPAAQTTRSGASRGRSKVASAAAGTRAVSSKRGMSKSMEPLIIRRRSGGPAAAQAMFAAAQDDESPFSNDASPYDVDASSSDDDAASPLAKQRAARGRGPAATTRASKPPPAAARGTTTAATKGGGKKKPAAKATKPVVRQAEPISAPQRGSRRGGRHAPSVTFAQHHPVPDDSDDEFTDDFGDDGVADTAPRMDPYAGYDDVIDSVSTARRQPAGAQRRQPQDHYERLAHGAASAATNAFAFGAGQATFRPKLDRPPSMRQPSNRRPATAATSLAPPAARSRPQSVSMAPPPAAANDPLRAFMQAAFPDQVSMPPNLSALQASNKGIRLPLTISKKKRAI